jgi:Mycotoxin biosynthesis protein UstYa
MLVGVSAIPKSEATKLSNKTIPRPGSDDYLVELDVFHQLHCLNDLRKAFYPDRFPDKWHYTADGKVDYKSVDHLHWGKSLPDCWLPVSRLP